MPVMREKKTPLALLNIRYFQDEKGIDYKKKGENHRKIRPFWKMKRIVLGVPVMLFLVLGFMGYKIGMNLVSEKVMNELSSQMTKKDYEDILKDPSVQQIIDKEMGTVEKNELLNNVSSDPSIKDAISQGPVATNVNSSYEKDTPTATTDDSNKEKNPSNEGNGKDTPAAANTDSDKDKDTAAGQDQTNEEQPSAEKTEPKLQFNSRTEVMKFLLSKFSMGELRGLAKKAEGGVTAQEKAEIKSTVLGRLTTEEYNAVRVFAVVEISKGQ